MNDDYLLRTLNESFRTITCFRTFAHFKFIHLYHISQILKLIYKFVALELVRPPYFDIPI